MPAPSKTWTAVAGTDLDADSPVPEGGLITVLRDNQIYLKEILHGTNEWTGRIPHTHDGLSDSNLNGVAGWNVLLEACPTSGPTYWTFSGATGSSPSTGLTTITGTSGNHIRQNMHNGGDLGYWGSGSSIVVSCFAKLTAAATVGAFSIGVSDAASTHTVDHAGTATQGGASALTTSWQRIWVSLTGGSTSGLPFSTHASNATALFRVDTTYSSPGANVIITGCQVTCGTTLVPFFWTPVESVQRRFIIIPAAPIFDLVTSQDNALALTAV